MTVKQLEEAIFEREGFRVRIEPLAGKAKSALPPYKPAYMSYNKWKLTEWKMRRLAPYIPFLKSVEVLRPDGSRTTSDMQIGNLRNAYFLALCEEEAAGVEQT